MPFDFHSNRKVYLDQQVKNTEKSIIPFLKNHFKTDDWSGFKVLELGCGEGGNLLPFTNLKAHCIGIDLNESKIEDGKKIMQEWIEKGVLELYFDDIFNPKIVEKFTNQFDVIILKDVIEHIPNKTKALAQMRDYLNKNGVLFIGWPPWYMPFGGHQQMCDSKILRTLPWMHLLPKPIYKSILKLFGESKTKIEALGEIVDFRVTINQMNRMAKTIGMKAVAKKFYFINPIYEYKFNLKTRVLLPFLTKIPYLRDFFTTSCYYLLK